MSRACQLFAAAALALVPAWALGADGSNAAAPSLASSEGDGSAFTGGSALSDHSILDFGPVFTDGIARDDYEPMFLTRGQSANVGGLALRFGWSGVHNTGNPVEGRRVRRTGTIAVL